MIVWLASYPRSGNTFFRIVLNKAFGIKTPTVYIGHDHTAFEVGRELVGHVADEMTVEEMVASPTTWVVKTHRRESDSFPAIYLHRDGRDSLVSYAQKRYDEQQHDSSEDAIRSLIRSSDSKTGTWGQNACHWLDRGSPNTVMVRFEDLIKNPQAVVGAALEKLGLPVPVLQNAEAVPPFSQLHGVNGDFFRQGVVGSYKTEMSDAAHTLFWSQSDNESAMQRLGYQR